MLGCFFLSFGAVREDEPEGFAYRRHRVNLGGTKHSRYLRREEISVSIYTKAERLAQISPRAAYPSSKLALQAQGVDIFVKDEYPSSKTALQIGIYKFFYL